MSRQLGHRASFVSRFVRWAVTQTDAPVTFHVLTGLAGIATVTPAYVETRLGTGRQRPNIFGMIVGESGRARKSWSMGLISRLLEDAAPDRLGLRIGSYESAIAELAKKPYMTIFEPEFSRFLSQTKGGNSGGYLQALKLGLTDLYDSAPISRATLKVRHEIKDYRLSLLGAISDSYLSEYTEPADFTGGFLSRWLFATGDRTEFMAEPEEGPAAESERRALVDLLRLIYTHGPSGAYVFDEPTRKTFNDWQVELDQLGAKAEPRLVGVIERAAALAKRLATLIAIDRIVNRDGYRVDARILDPILGAGYRREENASATWLVNRDDLETTMHIVSAHLQAVQRIVAKVEHTPAARAKAKVLHVLREDVATALGQVTKATGLRKREVQEILETLVLEERADVVLINGNPWHVRKPEASVDVQGASGLPLPKVPGRAEDAPPMIDLRGLPAPTAPSVPVSAGMIDDGRPSVVTDD